MTNQVGRPKKRIFKKDYPRVTALAAQGIPIPRMAEAFGMSSKAFRDRLAEDDELKHAFDVGRAAEEEAIVSAMHKQATDPTNPRSVQAGKFLLQSRHGYQETPPATTNVTHNTLKLEFPKAVPLKELPKQATALIEGEVVKPDE